MAELTIFVNEKGEGLQQIEQTLNQLDGIERVLGDTDDGELKIAFDDGKISGNRIISILHDHDFYITGNR